MTLFVSNLGQQITNDSLEAVFSTYGLVESSVIERGDVDADSKAYVQMPDADEAHHAVARLDGAVLNGKALSVRVATI